MHVLPRGCPVRFLPPYLPAPASPAAALAVLRRWYHRAALVLWPRARRFSLLCSTNLNGAVAQLAASLAAGEPRLECAELAAAIIDRIQQKATAMHGCTGHPAPATTPSRPALPAWHS